jgi:hypothetical protein
MHFGFCDYLSFVMVALLLLLLLVQVVLVVASAAGLLYEYLLEDLTSPHGPRCSLGGEWALLGATHLASS